MGTAKTGLDASEERKLWIAMFGLLAGYIMSNVAFFSNIKCEYYRTFFNTKTGYDAIRDSFYESGDEGKAEAVFTNSRFHVGERKLGAKRRAGNMAVKAPPVKGLTQSNSQRLSQPRSRKIPKSGCRKIGFAGRRLALSGWKTG